MKKNITSTRTKKNSQKPHVKWGSLIGAVACLLLAVALIVLNFTKTLIGFLPIDIFIAYGMFVAFLPLLIGVTLLMEEFVPSYTKYKTYEARRRYVYAVRKAVRESQRSLDAAYDNLRKNY